MFKFDVTFWIPSYWIYSFQSCNKWVLWSKNIILFIKRMLCCLTTRIYNKNILQIGTNRCRNHRKSYGEFGKINMTPKTAASKLLKKFMKLIHYKMQPSFMRTISSLTMIFVCTLHWNKNYDKTCILFQLQKAISNLNVPYNIIFSTEFSISKITIMVFPAFWNMFNLLNTFMLSLIRTIF